MGDANGVANFAFTITKAALGYDPASVLGRAFIIHNEAGGRVACSLLKNAQAVGSVGTYPGTTGGTIKGTISYTYTSNSVTVVGAVSGVEASKTAGSAANSMGVHIHTGSTCTDASLVGGHYYSGSTDPWTNKVYTSTAESTGMFTVTVSATDLGVTTESTAGRAFIIHNLAGGRIGCVLLGASETFSASYKGADNSYPGTTGSTIHGVVTAT